MDFCRVYHNPRRPVGSGSWAVRGLTEKGGKHHADLVCHHRLRPGQLCRGRDPGRLCLSGKPGCPKPAEEQAMTGSRAPGGYSRSPFIFVWSALHSECVQNQPGGTKFRPAGCVGYTILLVSGYPICSQKRYRITANWARVAVPVGFRVPSEVPATMLLATDHCMGSTA